MKPLDNNAKTRYNDNAIKKKGEYKIMNEKQIVTEAMKSCQWNQQELATHLGYTTQSSVSSRLNGKSMRVDTFVRFLSEMGYEVVVRSKSPNKNKNTWTIDYEKDTDKE